MSVLEIQHAGFIYVPGEAIFHQRKHRILDFEFSQIEHYELQFPSISGNDILPKRNGIMYCKMLVKQI